MPFSHGLHDSLFDIRDNARLAQQWTAAHTFESFSGNLQLFYAVTRCLEIVSEASRRLPAFVRDRHPELPWRAIMDAGNVYRHAYDNVAEEAVWRTVQHRLAPLLAMIEIELARADESPNSSPLPSEDMEP